MRTAIVIALSLLSFSAFGVHAANQQDDADNHDKSAKAEVTTEQTIKAIATGAIAIGMSPKQIEHAAKSMK
ncbi:hypothetical protein BIY21_06325 [Vibrio ponticus]|jgi:hypothetical protein|uniref:Uncharacterized protein n=1 Tax=Vibrio ponticus TaxID=265668 RepID=A0A3N3E096_9VIBR|nr:MULTISPECIES: hypothetical protein [Vibrio]OLQ95582.1 hypothetical protein BIY21_06325 [Vibrio ponticus]ROV60163.1 hypothetical protein EGH82_10185 [Vibrio ponticus]